ncbi:2-phospho-L-lactate guanylyltransferase [Novosphingobium sp. M1R2S20]|uniref:2-phospho-L-lactate guanylyltransferase n=1 Tax=Novosphingobium rhizovicinum TaxID=3228928 RepID=A0ABV3RBK6_9SPHN
MGEATTCWALIPIKPPGQGKSRLSGALDAQVRSRLVEAMLKRVADAARASPAIQRVCLLSDPELRCAAPLAVLNDAGGGLNTALEAAMATLPQPAPDRIVVIAADLPQLSPQDLTMLATVSPRTIAIAPDRHGMGTNAISLPITAAQRFRFQFGTQSFIAHRHEADRLGYSVETMLSDGLEKDIDEPADLPDAEVCLQEAL